MNTKSGRHQIFELTALVPGREIPSEFFTEAGEGAWFFMPSDWTLENGWGTALGRLRGFPLIYSQAYATEEAAYVAAEQWEIELEPLDQEYQQHVRLLSDF